MARLVARKPKPRSAPRINHRRESSPKSPALLLELERVRAEAKRQKRILPDRAPKRAAGAEAIVATFRGMPAEYALELFRCWVPTIEAAPVVLAHRGGKLETPLVHHGDLELATRTFVTQSLIVTGNVRVAGALVDCGPDSMIFVGGSLSCEALFTDGDICVVGDVVARDLVYGYYNDHMLFADELRARVVIEDDHGISADVTAKHHFDIDRYAQGFGPGVSKKMRALFRPELFTPEDTVDARLVSERLLAGKPVLR